MITALCLVALAAACTFPLTPSATTNGDAASATSASLTTAEPTEAAQPTAVVTATQEVTTTAVTTAASAVPAPTEDYEGLPVGFTAEGYPYRGRADAPITMYEYSDYQCPFCSRYFLQTEPALDLSYVRTGKVRVVFRDHPARRLHPNTGCPCGCAVHR